MSGTYGPALLSADVGWCDGLYSQTLLLHIKTPQPLISLFPTSTLATLTTPETDRKRGGGHTHQYNESHVVYFLIIQNT